VTAAIRADLTSEQVLVHPRTLSVNVDMPEVVARVGVLSRPTAGTIRTSRPNGTDRLVEVADGDAWVVVHYDSGWRDCQSLLNPDLVVEEGLKLRRVGSIVYAQCGVSVPAGWVSGSPIATLPTGFTPTVMDLYLPLGYGSSGMNSVLFGGGKWALYTGSQGGYRSNFAWPTVDGVPSGLPGVAFGGPAN
jgi:hypothetical protein